MKINTYLKFLLKSTNQHGVHSPFVYNLVTKCFYKKTIFDASIKSKKEKLLFKLCNYFTFENILAVISSSPNLTQAMRLGCPKSNIDIIDDKTPISSFIKSTSQNNIENNQDANPSRYDLIYFNNHQKEKTLIHFENLLQTTHNESVFIFDGIYESDGMTEIWKTIKHHSQVTVTVDVFYLGLVFFRKEQIKEHFTIRV